MCLSIKMGRLVWLSIESVLFLCQCKISSIGALCRDPHYPWLQSSWGQYGAHLGPLGPRWAPCWPHEPCYLGQLCMGYFHCNERYFHQWKKFPLLIITVLVTWASWLLRLQATWLLVQQIAQANNRENSSLYTKKDIHIYICKELYIQRNIYILIYAKKIALYCRTFARGIHWWQE